MHIEDDYYIKTPYYLSQYDDPQKVSVGHEHLVILHNDQLTIRKLFKSENDFIDNELWKEENEMIKYTGSGKITDISSGKDHTIIHADNDIYGYDTNWLGQLGVGGKEGARYPTPVKIPISGKVKQITGIYMFHLVLCED